ncbi:hypothetical protein GTP46_02810 [Duganella sp. FT135W]|uniref:Uncharacterized protein n=1 Tax=Duganella flavida TaxID=2692175 RepID=A0A6L8K522_9BURK|nr:hypothetical protein [Duganella flavida]MYM21577.1 hypothetical protein [Duganella flavida]
MRYWLWFGRDYEVDVDRWVVTIEVAYLQQINSKLQDFIKLWASPRVIPLSYAAESAGEFFNVISKLSHEVVAKTIGHVAGTEALLADRFRELIDQYYRENLQLQNYASMMGVSLVQLCAACAAAVGQSPTKMIHARVITEARRNLISSAAPPLALNEDRARRERARLSPR